MNIVVKTGVLFAVTLCIGLVLGVGLAHATTRYLWVQDRVHVGTWSTVQRIHDSDAGVNCYLATDETYAQLSENMPLAISCVKVTP